MYILSETCDSENYYYKYNNQWYSDITYSETFTIDFLGIPAYVFEDYSVSFNRLFKTDDGNTVSLLIQGLDYEASFDDMLSYFKSKNPEKLSVGKSSQTIIVVYDAENVEICSKLDDLYCLTTKAPDLETAEAFFSNVMIKVEGGDYTALDLSEDFEERV